jgi:hypothetical protein
MRVNNKYLLFGSVFLFSLLAACGGQEGEGGGSNTINLAAADPLQSIVVTPASATVNPCVPTAFVATAHYGGGASSVVTSQIQWAVDLATPYAVVNPTTGSVIGFSLGVAKIYAYSGNIVGSAVVTVSANDSMTLTPAVATIAINTSSQITAQACVTSISTDISTMVTWSSSDATIATVDATGKVTGVAAGSAVITATAGTLSNAVNLTVQ